jgi:hypothetical protein
MIGTNAYAQLPLCLDPGTHYFQLDNVKRDTAVCTRCGLIRQQPMALRNTGSGGVRDGVGQFVSAPSPFGPHAAPGPDGVVCAHGCDAWSISSDCEQHADR